MLQGRLITGNKAKQLVERGAVLFDTRDPVSYRNGTIAGAHNLQLRQVSGLLKYPKNTKLIFFGDAAKDEALLAIVNYALQYGFTEVYLLKSFDEWNKDPR